MVTRVIKKVSNFDEIKDTFNALHGISNACYVDSEEWNMEAETICAKIADGKVTVYKAQASAIRNNAFEAEDAMKIDTLIKAGFIVYMVNTTNYYKIKNLYERTYA